MDKPENNPAGPPRAAATSGSARTARGASTIHDVARAANVSIGTVSKVLNQSGSISAKTRARVMEAVQTLQFRPNSLAKSLLSGQSRTVGLISNDSFGRFTMPIMEGLEAQVSEAGMGVFMCNATDDPERERQHVEQLLGKRVDGLVVTARRSDHRPGMDLGMVDVPVVYVFASSDDPDAFALLPDDKGGAQMATTHLIHQGRRRIIHVTGPERFEAVRLRRAGYEAALAEAGIDPIPEGCLHGPWSETWGREAVGLLFDTRNPTPDALFCGNDQIARGTADALRERGLTVPDDVAIVGFDNWDVIVEACRPPLTSVDMNLRDLGREAGHSLIEMIDGSRKCGILRRPCTLVVRGSCGAEQKAGRVAGNEQGQGRLA